MVTATDHVTPEWKPSECRGTHMHILKNVSALCRAKKNKPQRRVKICCVISQLQSKRSSKKPDSMKARETETRAERRVKMNQTKHKVKQMLLHSAACFRTCRLTFYHTVCY